MNGVTRKELQENHDEGSMGILHGGWRWVEDVCFPVAWGRRGFRNWRERLRKPGLDARDVGGVRRNCEAAGAKADPTEMF
jgi:hypothetical protein